MTTKKVIDDFGKSVEINEDSKKLYSFSNKNNKIVYNAEIVENGCGIGIWTNYTEKGKVTDIEEKIKTRNNKILLLYASMVDFDAYKNDAKKEIYYKLLNYVKQNEELFFTKTGDFRKRFLVSENKILKMI